MTDILINLLTEDSVYNPTKNDVNTQKLDSMIMNSLIPLSS